MWKSLCLVLLFMYFIPSSDADCNYHKVANYLRNKAKTGDVFKGLIGLSLEARNLKLTGSGAAKIEVHDLKIGKVTVDINKKNDDDDDDDDDEMHMCCDDFINASITVQPHTTRPSSVPSKWIAAWIHANVTLCISIWSSKELGYYLGTAKALSDGKLHVQIPKGRDASLDGRCQIHGSLMETLKGKLANQCQNLVKEMNRDSDLKDICNKKSSCLTGDEK